MYFIVGFFDAVVLQEAAGHSLRGRFPHLRLSPVDTIPYLSTILEAIPAHVSDIVLHPGNENRPVHVVLTSGIMPVPSYLEIKTLHVLTWNQLEQAYSDWLESVYLPCNAIRMTYSPMALKPVRELFKPLEVDLIGGCSTQEIQLQFQNIAGELGFESRCVFTVRNAPTPLNRQHNPLPVDPARDRINVVITPFRSMHPKLMDLYYYSTDFELLFEQSRTHLRNYLESVTPLETDGKTFVVGFIVPASNPLGLFIGGKDPSNLKHFVHCLNDEIASWCATRHSTYYVDGDALAAAVGKTRTDDGLVNHFGHRGFLLDYDSHLDTDFPVTDLSVSKSFIISIDIYIENLVREILLRYIILTSEAKVKLVIIDLDNTLWRGLASDMRIGSWEGRPLALVEALLILKKRGILLAIASKNDEEYIRSHWQNILGSFAVSPLCIPLTLDDFAMARINFRPKAENIGEILHALNILPEHTVFIDDNSLERESAIAAFPALRTLGAEPNYIRRELLYSPYLQNAVITRDDLNRAELIKKRLETWVRSSDGGGADYLRSLGLHCRIGLVRVSDSAAQERAHQLLNKTNQWNLNGRRLEIGDMTRSVSEGAVYAVEVTDSGSSYGTIAVIVLDADRRHVEFMAISCRVIGLGIDDAVISVMLHKFGPLGFAFAETERNRAAQTFFLSHGWKGDTALPVLASIEHPAHITSRWDDSGLPA